MAEQTPPLARTNQPAPSPRNDVGSTSTPPLLDQLAAEARLDPWEVAEAIANTVNHVARGTPDPGQLADGITAPHTPDGLAGKSLLQQAWLDTLSLSQLAEFRRACASLDRQTLIELFDEILGLFGSHGGTD